MKNAKHNGYPELNAPSGLEAKRFVAPGQHWILLTFPTEADRGALALLTREERNVVVCALEGLSNSAIAEKLGKTLPTVRNQMQSAFRKLGVHSRVELVRLLVHGARPK